MRFLQDTARQIDPMLGGGIRRGPVDLIHCIIRNEVMAAGCVAFSVPSGLVERIAQMYEPALRRKVINGYRAMERKGIVHVWTGPE